MKYVLDSCVAFKWAVTEPYSDKADLLRDDFRNGIHQLVAPDFLPIELGHALAKAERQKRIKYGQGGALWANVMTTCPVLIPSLPLFAKAYAIASQARVGLYDCFYVELAVRENCELITSDDRLIKNLQRLYPMIRHLSTFP